MEGKRRKERKAEMVCGVGLIKAIKLIQMTTESFIFKGIGIIIIIESQ